MSQTKTLNIVTPMAWAIHAHPNERRPSTTLLNCTLLGNFHVLPHAFVLFMDPATMFWERRKPCVPEQFGGDVTQVAN